VDDAENVRKALDEDAKYLESRDMPTGTPAASLVDISPMEVRASANVNLLLGTEFEVQPLVQAQPLSRVHVKEQFAYAGAGKDKKSKPMPTSLLD
jgi:hypothetical protein